MPKTFLQIKDEMKSPLFINTASKWIKNAITELEDQDVVDVLNELEFLHTYFTEKFLCNIPPSQRNKKHSPFNK